MTYPFFFFNDTATTEIYTLSLHDALPISLCRTPRFLGSGPRSHFDSGAPMKSRVEELKNISGQQFDLCVIGGGATGSAFALEAGLGGDWTLFLERGGLSGATFTSATQHIYGRG